MKKGSVIVVSGPSGAGKGTVMHRVMEELGNIFFSVSVTTRDPRPGEVDGVDYRFITEKEYQDILAADAFLETAEVHGCYYGTPAVPVLDAVAKGQDAMLDIDVQGAAQVMKRMSDCVTVFLMPPSMQTLEKRLRGRKTETEDKILKRLRNARSEVREAGKYQYIVVNGDLDKAVDDLKQIVLAARNRTSVQEDELADIVKTFED